MSLIRLLTTTRSLSDVKNEPSPYRMTEQGLLPKFGPRRKAREAAPPPEETRAVTAKLNLGEGNGDRKDAGCSLKPESSRKPAGLTGWWQRLFGRKARRERREPVQAELALDLVRVVRNDLCDADAQAQAQKPAKSKPKLEPQPSEESVFGATRG
jgi:hypothetical protein